MDKLIYTLVAAFFISFNCIAQPGSLDPGFGTGGKVTTAIGSSNDIGRSIAIQGDGKIVVAGFSNNGSYNEIALTRYITTGILDTTFGTGGKVTTGIGSYYCMANAVTMQGDGKIVVAGLRSNGTNDDIALVRYNTAGSLDTTFGIGGIVTTAIGTFNEEASSVAIQGNGKIVVAGYSYNPTAQFALVRYTNTGALDAGFGIGGKVTTAVGGLIDLGLSMAIQSDGKIIISGASNNGSDNDFALARYDTAGTLDATFGNGGIVITAVGNSDDYGRAVAIQSDGKIVVGGEGSSGSMNSDFALVRYDTTGHVDTTFGNSGKVITPIGSTDERGFSVVIQPDDKIVVAGDSYLGTDDDFALVRYNTTGNQDSTFGNNGIVTTDFGNYNDVGISAAIQSDGKIVVAGASYNGVNLDFALARYNSTTTGITNVEEQHPGIKIYPNPFIHSATIEIQNTKFPAENLELIIYDVLGQQVHQQTLISQKETLILNLTGGIYFYKVSVAGNQGETIADGKLVSAE